MDFEECPGREGRSRTTTSGSPAGSSWPSAHGQRTTRSLGANQRKPPWSTMPLPLASPKRRVTSARPSPVVSRSATTPPPVRPPTATKTSPFAATATWRAAPRSRATTTAQKPSGRRRPPSSGSHWTVSGRLGGSAAEGDGGTAGRQVAAPVAAISVRDRRSGTVRRMVELRDEDSRIVRWSKVKGRRPSRRPAEPPSRLDSAPYGRRIHLHDARPAEGRAPLPRDPQGHPPRLLSRRQDRRHRGERLGEVHPPPHHGGGGPRFPRRCPPAP